MMQALLEWIDMDGYGVYVWSVLAIVILVIGYEVGRLKMAQRRNLHRYKSFNEEVEL